MYIKVNVTAGARKEFLVSRSESVFDASVKEPAQQNMANRRVQELLAAHFGLSAGAVRLITGHHGRSKVFDVGV